MTKEDIKIRKNFPILSKDIAYIDNAATTQKPISVIQKEVEYYKEYNANPMRGLYDLSIKATDIYEEARKMVRSFINAKSCNEIIFTRNTTESINLIAYSYAMSNINEGDEIIISVEEHHSNMLPWQFVCKQKKAILTYIYPEKDGYLSPDKLKEKISTKTKLVSITHISNVLGRINDIKEFTKIAHKVGALISIDAAQSIAHIPIDVRDISCDFLSFSGHKMYAPMGIGVLYGKTEILKKMPPFLYGGEMIDKVTEQSALYTDIPHRFEAGTVNVGAAAGLLEAISFIKKVKFDTIMLREEKLMEYVFSKIKSIPHINIIGSNKYNEHNGILTFTVDNVHPHDVSQVMAADGVCIRAGHHCAEPLHTYLGIMSSNRASFSFYNTIEDATRFIDSLKTVRPRLGYRD